MKIDPALVQRVLDQAVVIQQTPAPTFGEAQRAALVKHSFLAEGLSDVHVDALGNVFGRLPGDQTGRPVVVSAHTDTVFPESTDLGLRREIDKIFGPGIGDNSLGVAGLFGLIWLLRDQVNPIAVSRLPGDIWLVANVGEEGLGDLCGMRAVVDRFGDSPLAYLVLEGMALGQVYHRALGVQRYQIAVNAAGGHSWVDYGRPSAIHELARLVTRLVDLPVSRNPRTSLNVGKISGGTSVNTIAPQATLELDMRSEGERTLKNMVDKVLHLVENTNRADVKASYQLIGSRPAGKIPTDHPLVLLARRCLEQQGIQPNLSIGSTDANVPLSKGLPAVCIGLTTGHGAHTVQEYIHTSPLAIGLAQLAALVMGAFTLK